jgi:hypothetical protein
MEGVGLGDKRTREQYEENISAWYSCFGEKVIGTLSTEYDVHQLNDWENFYV